MSIKKVATFVAGFITGIIVIYGWGQISNKTDIFKKAEQSQNTSVVDIDNDIVTSIVSDKVLINNGEILVSTQSAGTTTIVKSLNLKTGVNGGWVVVHEVKDGIIMNALGAVRKDSGIHNDVEVKLLRGTVTGGTYAVVLYTDNGDRQFNMAIDKPLKNAAGEYIMATFETQ